MHAAAGSMISSWHDTVVRLSAVSVKPCPYCRRKVRQWLNSATVAVVSLFSATVWTGLNAVYCGARGQSVISNQNGLSVPLQNEQRT